MLHTKESNVYGDRLCNKYVLPRQLPDRRTIINSFPVISTNGGCLGVRLRMKIVSGEL
jgi:hypothetical protein